MNYYRVMIPDLNVDDNKGMAQLSLTSSMNLLCWTGLQAENMRLEKPALFIASKRDYICCAELGIAATKQWVPHAEIIELGCGHWTMLEESEQFNQALERWLETLPSPNRAQL